MAKATITSKGQVTIPKKIREKMHLHAGDKVYFQIDKKETLKMKKSTVSIKDRTGSLEQYKRSKPVSIEEMDKAIKQKAIERHKRSK